MTFETFTIIFWNVWAYSQDGTRDNGTKLVAKLNLLINKFNPDAFGLNEVMLNQNSNSSIIIEYLEEQGYACHYTVLSPANEDWIFGNLLATKQQPAMVREHILGPDTAGAKRGFLNYNVKAIEAEILVNHTKITLLLNYLCSLPQLNWGTHIVQRKNYERVVAGITNKNLIIGGDFNETKYMLPRWRLSKYLQSKTGTLFNPTWRLNGQLKQLLFANLDYLIYSKKGQLRLQTFKVLDRQPSDHAPLLGIFTIS